MVQIIVIFSHGRILRARLCRCRPLSIAQQLVWLELRFVGHLWALCNPIAQIHVSQTKRFGLCDLPQHGEGAQTRGQLGVGIIERVNR